MRQKMSQVCQVIGQWSDWDLLHLSIPNSENQKCITWLISQYVDYAWRKFSISDSGLNINKFYGFLTFKYKESGYMWDSIGFKL